MKQVWQNLSFVSTKLWWRILIYPHRQPSVRKLGPTRGLYTPLQSVKKNAQGCKWKIESWRKSRSLLWGDWLQQSVVEKLHAETRLQCGETAFDALLTCREHQLTITCCPFSINTLVISMYGITYTCWRWGCRSVRWGGVTDLPWSAKPYDSVGLKTRPDETSRPEQQLAPVRPHKAENR